MSNENVLEYIHFIYVHACECDRAREEEIGEREREGERGRRRNGSHLVTGCVHDAAQFKCSGHPLNIFEK